MGILGPSQYWLYQQANRNTANNRVSDCAAGYVVTSDPISVTHRFATSGIVPAVSGNWYANLYVNTYDSSRFSLRYNQDPPSRGATIDWSLRLGSAVAISAGSTSYTITHNTGSASTVIIPTVNWNTPVYISSRGATQHVVKFAIEAPNSQLLWWATHADSDDETGSAEAVTAGSYAHTITHGLGQIGPFFWLTSWPTTAKIHSRTETTTTLAFQVEAPSGATIDWRAKKPCAS
jgi:hypothetical protein